MAICTYGFASAFIDTGRHVLSASTFWTCLPVLDLDFSPVRVVVPTSKGFFFTVKLRS